jgi:alkylation response protein AidB-like acyl-CoA dehydrogenase
MTTFQPALRDIRYLLAHVIPTGEILALPAYRHVDAETLDAVIAAAVRFCASEVAPLNRASDRIGARLENGRVVSAPGTPALYAKWRAAGWPALVLPQAFGGQGLPELAQAALSDAINGASLAFAMAVTASRAAARVLIAHADEATRRLYVPKLASGEWAGTIVMTEPHAGSDIGLARTRAAKRADGRYAVSGTKIFISWADHDLTEQIAHIVLARAEGGPPGVRGLSLFLVPARRLDEAGRPGIANGVRVLRLEEKMGIHGSPTCEVAFDGAEGILIGAEGDGIRQMFTMINTMRLEVAFEGAGIAGAACDHALRYALQRPQGSVAGKSGPQVIAEHPDVRRMILTMKSTADASRALCFEAAYRIDLARAGETAAARAAGADMAAWLLPIAKAGCTEAALEVASLGIQIHGGHGYVRDAGAEQFYRDARITPIFEGTNGIQAIDLATRKLIGSEGRLYRAFADRIKADLSRTKGNRAVRVARGIVQDGLNDLDEVAGQFLAQGKEGALDDVLAGAKPFLELAARVAFGWMLLRLAAVDAKGADETTVEEKRALARFYAEHVMPDCEALALSATQGAKGLCAIDMARFSNG